MSPVSPLAQTHGRKLAPVSVGGPWVARASTGLEALFSVLIIAGRLCRKFCPAISFSLNIVISTIVENMRSLFPSPEKLPSGKYYFGSNMFDTHVHHLAIIQYTIGVLGGILDGLANLICAT